MALLDDINRLLRDHTGYTGDGQGGNGALPVGDRSTARYVPSIRDWREILKLMAQAQGDPQALQEILTRQSQWGIIPVVVGGTVDAITATLPDGVDVVYGTKIMLGPLGANTGPVTLTIDGETLPVMKDGGNNLIAGDINANRIIFLRKGNAAWHVFAGLSSSTGTLRDTRFYQSSADAIASLQSVPPGIIFAMIWENGGITYRNINATNNRMFSTGNPWGVVFRVDADWVRGIVGTQFDSERSARAAAVSTLEASLQEAMGDLAQAVEDRVASLSVAGTIYPSLAAGLAETSSGKTFSAAVSGGIGVYTNNAGSAEQIASFAPATVAAAVDRLGNILTGFRDVDYIPAAQIALIRAGNIADQSASVVTAGLQAMHDAMMAAAMMGAGNIHVTAHYSGSYAINGELFSETFAENLWVFPQGTGQFHFVAEGAAEFVAKGWPSHKAARSSGWYQRRGITTPVPMAMFRFEQAVKRPTGPILKGVLRFVGENAVTDPIGFRARNINKMERGTIQYLNIANIAQMIDDVNNSREYSTTFDRCGLQPTAIGGSGFIPDDVRFSTSGTTLTASKSVFVSGHIGAEFLLHGGGENGTHWMGTIVAVTSPTQATLSRAAQSRSNVSGSFGPVRGDMSAGSKTLTLAGPATTLDWTGRYVMVPKAASIIHAEQDLLVTRCVAQSGNVLTLATAAAFDVVKVPVILAPSKFTGKSDDQVTVAGAAEAGHNNDYQVWSERNEFSYTPARGSAVSAVYQNCLEHLISGSKGHGSSPDMQNAAAGFCGIIVDHCKYITLPQFLLSWNGWSLDAAKVWIMGTRNDIRMPGLSIGTPEEGSHTAMLKVDPRSASLGDCFVALDGYVNAPGWPKAAQVFARYGLYGSAAMIERTGPFRVRDTGNNPMP